MSARHTTKISDSVKTALAYAEIREDRVILPQLSPTDYRAAANVLGELGYKWSRKDGALMATQPRARARLEAALGTGVVQRDKVIRQAFHTPPEAAEALAGYVAEIVTGPVLRLLEPSAGGGALVTAGLQRLSGPAIVDLAAIEIDKDAVHALALRGILARCADFLTQTLEQIGRFDVVLMNPPYQNGQASEHIAHALRFVRYGGVLGAIVAANFPETLSGVAFESHALPPKSFAASGTNIDTKMIRVKL